MDCEINSNVLRKVQLVQLEILNEFDRICKMNNLPYQLFSGSLLGAVRHKGFIPWDDDVDVCMLRKDYNRFLKICREELDESYFLQTHETDKEYIHSFARIRKNNTFALQHYYSNVDMHHGIFIDVFPLDNILPNTILGKLQYFAIYILRKLKFIKIKALHSNNIYKKIVERILYYLLKPFKMNTINKIETKIACMFENRNTKFSTCLTEGEKDVYYRYIVENDEFYDIVQMEFEGHLFPAPRDYHKILTRNFNDYMSLPPIEERKPHHGIIEVNFDKISERYS
ncbi:MAG: LicD family protein [Tissierellia bacterium]|nr:LicD family protein [Tissierellia bacterium]